MLIYAPREDLCLAYANTLFWRGREQPTETLQDASDLLGWLEKTAGLSATAKREIGKWSRQNRDQAGKAFADAIALREALYRTLAALAAAEPVRRPDFVVLQNALAHAPTRHRLVRAGTTGYAWQVERLRPSAPHLLAPVLWSAGDLMIRGAHSHVHRCANNECVWLFRDASRNATRRWCDMASCGNRAKARRHYLKTRQG